MRDSASTLRQSQGQGGRWTSETTEAAIRTVSIRFFVDSILPLIGTRSFFARASSRASS